MQKKSEYSWVRCPHCRHKLFKMLDNPKKPPEHQSKIEVKCHSCKEIVTINV